MGLELTIASVAVNDSNGANEMEESLSRRSSHVQVVHNDAQILFLDRSKTTSLGVYGDEITCSKW